MESFYESNKDLTSQINEQLEQIKKRRQEMSESEDPANQTDAAMDKHEEELRNALALMDAKKKTISEGVAGMN